MAASGWVLFLNRLDEAPLPALHAAAPASFEVVARGQYLARVGNCIGCHTARGGRDYAGGAGVQTPFGAIYAPNLTPHAGTGLGGWTAAEFWRAMHNGRSRDGRLLYPAFPYPNYTLVTREDSDALFAYLQSLEPVDNASPAHALRFPFNTQAALAVWRALFFRPAAPSERAVMAATPVDATQQARLNRGAYLVQGLGHCAACHTPRNAWGAPRARASLQGGMVAGQGWYAPALDMPSEAGLAGWDADDAAVLLATGVSARASVSGPMADVVFHSLQYWSEADMQAAVAWLQALPQRPPSASGDAARPSQAALQRGEQLYGRHCAECHGNQGEGRAQAFPALAGNRAVLLQDPTNLVRLVLQGGYAPATAGNPRPFGMPPFMQTLSDQETADVLSFIRNAWGNEAGKVDTMAVHRARERRGP
ncbi:cytochrome c [Pulveribacter suum]|uniref:Alcohol dehydrogenase n=1 Tax=Pulveribacter suum TaxID=2116657 RepID=A0A2P1NMG9_9BURK|nr:cytochrome c [Pulveribacter suum]AVP58250.1 alcohol dehydrogenase [Pulveribacter suum]